ncbi:hypothetical protein P9112_001936 [Eukaryota sp. TZLM1-RC]
MSSTELPKATVTKVIKEALPEKMRISADARDTLIRSCNVFIQRLSSRSNDICLSEERKTIMPEHIYSALNEIGFPEHVEQCQQSVETFRVAETTKPRLKRTTSDFTDPDLLAEQRRIFEEAARSCSTEAPTVIAASLDRPVEPSEHDELDEI